MKETAYETSAGRLIANLEKTITSIKQWLIKLDGESTNMGIRSIGEYQCSFITGERSIDSEIPLFIHPVLVRHKDKNYLVSDLRMYFSKDPNGDGQKIRNLTEYNFAKSKVVLGALWLAGKENEIRIGLRFAADVFSSWLSETISKNYGLDFGDQLNLRILLHFYYLNLFHRETIIDESTRQSWAVHTIKATKAESKLVFSIFDSLEKMEDMDALCESCKKVIKNTALYNFNKAVLLTLIRSAWFGNYAKENLSVAIEHPPTWCAIIYSAVTEKTYKNSTIYKYVEKLGKRGADQEFIDVYNRIMYEYTEIDVSKEDLKDDLFARLENFK